MLKIAAEKDVFAIGRIAGRLGCRVQEIEHVAETWGIQPALFVNNVIFFDRDAVDEIEKHVFNRIAK